jgi:anti-anti-sigma factor
MSQDSFRVDVDRPADSTARLRLRGRLVGPDAGRRLIDSAGASTAQASRLVLDFDGLEYMDCAGVGSLVQIACASRSAGRRLELTGMNSRVRELMDAVGCFDALDAGTT